MKFWFKRCCLNVWPGPFRRKFSAKTLVTFIMLQHPWVLNLTQHNDSVTPVVTLIHFFHAHCLVQDWVATVDSKLLGEFYIVGAVVLSMVGFQTLRTWASLEIHGLGRCGSCSDQLLNLYGREESPNK